MGNNNLFFKRGTVKLNNKVCGKIKDFNISINNNCSMINFTTTRKYDFLITLKLPFIDRVKHFFGGKTKFEKILDKQI